MSGSAGSGGGTSYDTYQRLNGAATTVRCRNQIDKIPAHIRTGEMGWPCYLGGAVAVPRAASSESPKPRNCIVSYYPDPAPDLSLNPSFAVQSWVTIYDAAAEFCSPKGYFK